MTIEEILEAVSFKYNHAFSDNDLIKVINRIQKELFRKLFKPETSSIYNLVADNPFYSIDFSPQNIIKVVVGGTEYPLKTLSESATSRFYYITDSNVGIYPTPTESQTSGLVIFRYKEPQKLTTSDMLLEPEFDSTWHMLIVYRICKELAESAMDPDMGNYFIGQINSLEEEYRGSTHMAASEIQLPEWG